MASYDIDTNKNEDAMKLLISQMQRKLEAISLGGGQKKIDKQQMADLLAFLRQEE